jgi:enoyl-CoA hydratase/carnithine racemase
VSDGIRIETVGRVAVLTLDRPDRRNAIDRPTRVAIAAGLERLDADEGVRVAVITGAGTAFCAGVDLKDTAAPSGPAWLDERLVAPFERFGKPLVAAVNGPAVGGGFEIALACEVRVASPEASFALPEVKMGSMPGSGGTQRIFRALPSAVAWKTLLTGGALDAAAAHRWGLVTDVFAEDLVPSAIAVAEQIAAAAPLSLDAVKRVGSAAIDDAAGMELERVLWALLSTTEDRAEGRAAFREKRPPEYRGR